MPVKFRDTLEPAKVEALAEDILEHGQQAPISVRRDKNRYVLIAGYHRLQAIQALGESSIQAYLVSARQF